MAIDAERLGNRQHRELAVQVAPARLDDRHSRVAEVRDGRSEKVGLRHRVGIEDRHELSAHLLEPRCERAGLEPRALATVEVDRREPSRTELARRLGGDPAGVVGRVVENLNLETVAWVVKSAHSLEQAARRSEEHTSELQSLAYLVCRLLLEKKKKTQTTPPRPVT